MWAEFKEKPFETYFLAEMARITDVLFSPDQTDEGILGFDGAFFVPDPHFRFLFPFTRSRRWPHFLGMTASEIGDLGGALDARLPPFNLNLFVQYKRPEWMRRSTATEWASWNEAYYRYTIDQKQQGLLEKVFSAAAGRAAVVYACAAFWTNRDLFALAGTNEIIANSNIASADLLTGHNRFTYTAAGGQGIAHSDPERIESASLDAIFAAAAKNERLPFTKHVKATADLIERSLEEGSADYVLWRSARDAILGGDIADDFPRARGTWMDAVLSMMAFSQAFEIRVAAVGIE
ncbi:hypothetical protein [Parerythrobacter jejuensis]|uniref:Uncharacterized protein n=1 Tax=Parerythrobacter jejuensis TaxID=795812 RepID=A0A845AQJ0_9SPHN|nr:hypothetical protein [Parerythrobacter jejuensis]MXP31729.1 hypothetical protein [Parerythrobacter jejuensis]